MGILSAVSGAVGTVRAVGTAIVAEVTTFITPEMLQPIPETMNANLTILVPVGIGIMSTMIGVGLIPRIVYKFL